MTYCCIRTRRKLCILLDIMVFYRRSVHKMKSLFFCMHYELCLALLTILCNMTFRHIYIMMYYDTLKLYDGFTRSVNGQLTNMIFSPINNNFNANITNPPFNCIGSSLHDKQMTSNTQITYCLVLGSCNYGLRINSKER